ncbi:hypothetical protein Pmani_017577 [Petrolisthes manimaculis]|uniref:Transcriptional coactivator p15 (PC4) C-terminal domain-containing protein n=1 Tax=Petrolisthes manimaculis TaxID=1843537 RepID=A0AAE1PPU3_9EUCA|nr:hypothetical protein Pmani_017577 [Petrolisthes manimaculis]
MADKGKRSLDDSDSDSGPDDRNVEQPAKSSGGGAKRFKTSDGDVYFELEKLKRVTVREFRNKIYVDIREFYEKDGKMLPGKKGIALNTSGWSKLKNLIDDVDEEIQKMA